jgi:vitamin B12 transporter
MKFHVSAGAAVACLALSPLDSEANAQSTTQQLPDLIVTADRTPEDIDKTGSAISVIGGATLASSNPGSLVDALRTVPGLDVSESGGPGSTANVRIRGANTGQTLVMIDGIRINDPTTASGDFDFSILGPSAIERIEVLRGPQSALYGSDAMGGVINIITKSGKGPAQFSLRSEAGSYGTVTTSAALTGSQGAWTYAVTGGAGRSEGFSRYGYRIPAIEAKFPNLENDGYNRLGGSARVGYDAGEGFRVETGILSSFTRSDYDAASGAFPDTPSNATRLLNQVWSKATVDTFNGLWTHSLNLFATQTNRMFNDVTYKTNMLPANTTSTVSNFLGNSVGAEYQSTLKMGWAGSLVYGAKTQHDTADTSAYQLQGKPALLPSPLSATQDTNSLFALWQLPIGERLSLTLGGRIDDVVNVATFETWRTTAAYSITETGTKLRASAGTGAKSPTLYQLYVQPYGNTALSPEQSFGYDAGIDQSLFNGRMTVSFTAFSNHFTNLIDFVFDDPVAHPLGHYVNVTRAETSGIELGADVTILPGFVKFTAAYTYLHAKDLASNLTLQRRPTDVTRLALSLTPTDKWLIEPRVTMVSKRFSGSNETSPLDPYTRVDLYSEYKIDPTWKVFARGENIFNAHYQEVLNYGTTGPAVYGGLSATW